MDGAKCTSGWPSAFVPWCSFIWSCAGNGSVRSRNRSSMEAHTAVNLHAGRPASSQEALAYCWSLRDVGRSSRLREQKLSKVLDWHLTKKGMEREAPTHQRMIDFATAEIVAISKKPWASELNDYLTNQHRNAGCGLRHRTIEFIKGRALHRRHRPHCEYQCQLV